MQIYIIDNFSTFVELRESWDSVYLADRYAHFFPSWEWLSGWLQMVHGPWLILAAKPTNYDAWVAFFPLKLSVDYGDSGGLRRELCMAGNSAADYTGLICLPGYEQEAISAFAEHVLGELNWSSFSLGGILKTDPRVKLFLKHFPRVDFEFKQIWIKNKGEETDNYVAPYTLLRDDWNDYLQHSVSSNTRQKIRRFLRKIDNSNEFHVSEVNADSLQSHIEVLLNFWQAKWRDRKGDDCDIIADYVRGILTHCYKHSCLYFPILWKGDRPLGAIANFVDRRRKVFLFYISGRDETFKLLPPGLVLHAHAIRYAIQHGFKVYDFLRGNEDYKYSFGAEERYIQHIEVAPRNPTKHAVDVRAVPLIFQRAVDQHGGNQLCEAEQRYRHESRSGRNR